MRVAYYTDIYLQTDFNCPICSPMMIDTERSVGKWNEAAKGGFQIVPDILFKKQVELGLSATDMLVLMNVTMHWWYPDQRPFPRVTTIADRMGVDARTVQRSMRKLVDLDLMKRMTETTEEGEERVVCDFKGLIERLGQYVQNDTNYQIRKGRAQSEALAASP